MDGLEDLYDIVIIGATNRPDMLDTALLRPGRFDRLILTPVPDEKARLEIFKVHTASMPLKDVDLEKLAKLAVGYVGADIQAVCREAAILALRSDMSAKSVTESNFLDAMKKTKASVSKSLEKAYSEISDYMQNKRSKEMKEIREERPSYMG